MNRLIIRLKLLVIIARRQFGDCHQAAAEDPSVAIICTNLNARARAGMADIHLYRARLFFREQVYPWNTHPDGSSRGPKDDLRAAEALINKCGYHRRDEELADAKRAILSK